MSDAPYVEADWDSAGNARYTIVGVSLVDAKTARCVLYGVDLLTVAEDFLLDHRNGLRPDPERLAALILKIAGDA